MSVVEVYKPRFEDFHSEAAVTWREGRGPIQVANNHLEQHQRWMHTKAGKDEPPQVFWDSAGPAIARALAFCGAKALVIEPPYDRRVAYRWFARSQSSQWANSNDWYCICPVYAEGVMRGSDTRVHVTLPTEEEVVFHFHWSQLSGLYKPLDEPAEASP